jgi:tagatose 1,6-diphosphate aldolase
MVNLSVGKISGLRQIASEDGFLIMCAMDHRGSLQKMLNPVNSESVTYEQMVDFKLDLCSTLAKYASGILLDPIFGAAQCLSQSILPKGTGLLVSVEATGYEGSKEHRVTKLLDGWGVEKIKRMGASAVKILLFYRPDLKQLADQQLQTIKGVAEECIKYDIPFLVEPMTYPITTTIENPSELAELKSNLVIETARDMTALPIDILKAEFPGDIRYQDSKVLLKHCQQLNEASRLPWVILSAGVDFDFFYQQVELACKTGASGFLGGRAIWQEVIAIPNREDRIKWLSSTGADRVKRLADVTHKYATPWYKKLGLPANKLTLTKENWYHQY